MLYNKYYELNISLYSLKDIPYNESYEKVSILLNYSFNKSPYMSKLHKGKGLKHYSFSGLYPIEKDRVYKSDEIYGILIRSYNKSIIDEIQRCMVNLKNKDFVVTNITLKEWKNKKIQFLDNLTPTVITLIEGNKHRSWDDKVDSKDLLNDRLYNNMVKKYNSLNNTEISFKYSDIIKDIKIKKNIPIFVNYKGIRMMGYKLRVIFQENDIAQDFANLIAVEGSGYKNSSLGMGFMKPYFV